MHQYSKGDAAKAPWADAQWHNSDGQSEGLQREQRRRRRWVQRTLEEKWYKIWRRCGGFESEVQVESEKRRGEKKKKKRQRLSLLRRYLSQAAAPLVETKWLAGIWCNLHLSAKSWILFLRSRCWRAWRKAQLTGPHSWDRCLWPIYRRSSAQPRTTTLIGNLGEARWSLSPPIVLNKRKKKLKLSLCSIVFSHQVKFGETDSKILIQ